MVAVQDLGPEVVGQQSVIAGDGRGSRRLGTTLYGQRCKVQTDGPSLGAFQETDHVGLRRMHAVLLQESRSG